MVTLFLLGEQLNPFLDRHLMDPFFVFGQSFGMPCVSYFPSIKNIFPEINMIPDA